MARKTPAKKKAAKKPRKPRAKFVMVEWTDTTGRYHGANYREDEVKTLLAALKARGVDEVVLDEDKVVKLGAQSNPRPKRGRARKWAEGTKGKMPTFKRGRGPVKRFPLLRGISGLSAEEMRAVSRLMMQEGMSQEEAHARLGLPWWAHDPDEHDPDGPGWTVKVNARPKIVVITASVKAKALAKLQKIAEKYAKYEREGRGVPAHAIPRVPYPTSSGFLKAYGDEWLPGGYYGFSRYIAAGLKIGSDFAWPEGVGRRERAEWDRGYAAQKKIHDKVIAAARKALEPFVKKHGGHIEEKDGTNYSVIGWAIPVKGRNPDPKPACSVCKRDMQPYEVGDEFPDERVCNACAGLDECPRCGQPSPGSALHRKCGPAGCGCPDSYVNLRGERDCPRHGIHRNPRSVDWGRHNRETCQRLPRENPERVTFGPLKKWEEAAASGDIFLDGKLVGEISVEYYDACSTLGREWRVAGYSADFMDDFDNHYTFTEDALKKPRTIYGEPRVTLQPGARAALARLRKRIRDALDPKMASLPKGMHGPRQRRPRKNPGRQPGDRGVHPLAFVARDRYLADLEEPGHQEAAEYWRGQAAGLFVAANPCAGFVVCTPPARSLRTPARPLPRPRSRPRPAGPSGADLDKMMGAKGEVIEVVAEVDEQLRRLGIMTPQIEDELRRCIHLNDVECARSLLPEHQGPKPLWEMLDNPTTAEALLEKAVRPCMTQSEANRAADSIQRSLMNVRRHKIVPEAHRAKISRLLGTARDAETPRGRIRAISGANRLLSQLRSHGAGSRRPSKGYRRPKPEKDPRLGHLFHGPPLSEEALARRAEAGYAANPGLDSSHCVVYVGWDGEKDLPPEIMHCGSYNECWVWILKNQGQSVDWAMKHGGYSIQPAPWVVTANPYPFMEPGWQRPSALGIESWAWITLQVLNQALVPGSRMQDHHSLRGQAPVARIEYSFWLNVVERSSGQEVGVEAARQRWDRWKNRCSDYGLERYDAYDMHHNRRKGWFALDVLSAYDAVWAVLGVPHPLGAAVAPIGGAERGETREHDLLTQGRERSMSEGMAPGELRWWDSELDTHARFHSDPDWYPPEGKQPTAALKVRHYATYYPGGGKARVAEQEEAKGRFEQRRLAKR